MMILDSTVTDGGRGEINLNQSVTAMQEAVFALLMAVVTLEKTRYPDDRRGISLQDEVRRFERNIIARTLKHAGGNQAKAARILDMSKTTLHHKIKQHNIKPDFPHGDRGPIRPHTGFGAHLETDE